MICKPQQMCEACLAGKQPRVAIPYKAQYKSSKPLEFISIDLCGPISPETQAGNKYFLLLVDDCTRFMWVSFLKTKDQALENFKVFKSRLENEWDLKIKCVRSDRGGEFTSHEFNEFCEKEGIKRQLTTPYTPQHNGMVERRNGSILDMTRSLLKGMKMPQDLWAEAVRHLVYILNRIPTRGLEGGTPYEALKGRTPNLEHLRVFGCVAHVKTVRPHLRTLDDRSSPMVYLGVEEGTEGYRLYCPQSNRVVISKDVQFEEGRQGNWAQYGAVGSNTDTSWTEFEVSDAAYSGSSDNASEMTENAVLGESGPGVVSSGTSQETQSGLRRSSRTHVLPQRLNDYVVEEWLRTRS